MTTESENKNPPFIRIDNKPIIKFKNQIGHTTDLLQFAHNSSILQSSPSVEMQSGNLAESETDPRQDEEEEKES